MTQTEFKLSGGKKKTPGPTPSSHIVGISQRLADLNRTEVSIWVPVLEHSLILILKYTGCQEVPVLLQNNHQSIDYRMI